MPQVWSQLEIVLTQFDEVIRIWTDKNDQLRLELARALPDRVLIIKAINVDVESHDSFCTVSSFNYCIVTELLVNLTSEWEFIAFCIKPILYITALQLKDGRTWIDTINVAFC